MLILERIQQVLPEEPPGEQFPPDQPPPQGRGAWLMLQVFGRDAGNVFALNDCQVRVAEGRRVVAQGRTDRVGRFRAQLANGSYKVTVVKDGFNMGATGVIMAGQNLTRTVYLDRQPGEGLDRPGEQPPARLPALHVRVMVSFPKPPKQGQPGGFATQPASGAKVTIAVGRRVIASGDTDQGGNFTTRLAPGSYQINVSHGNMRESQGVTLQQSDVSRTITLQSGAGLLTPPLKQPAKPIQPQPLQGPLKMLPINPQLQRLR